MDKLGLVHCKRSFHVKLDVGALLGARCGFATSPICRWQCLVDVELQKQLFDSEQCAYITTNVVIVTIPT